MLSILWGAICSMAITPKALRAQYPLLHIGAKLSCPGGGYGCTKDDGSDGNGKDYPYAMTDADANVLEAYSLIHVSTRHADQVKLWHSHSTAPAVKYVESVPVCGGSRGQETPYVVGCNSTHNFETGGFRQDAMVYHVANLTQSISPTDTEFSVCAAVEYCCRRYGAPLVPSTASGDYSDYEGTDYVTFVRLGDELMKLVDATTMSNPDPYASPTQWCQRLTVQRGLDKSVPASAAAGAPLLAPVYMHTPVWKGKRASGQLRYVADYASEYAWKSLAQFTVDAVTQLGYDGAWIDSFSPSSVRNGADPAGNKVSVWNPATARPYTPREASDAQMARLQKVWKYTKAKLGKFPILWANNFEKWFDQELRSGYVFPGDRRFMLPDPHTHNRPFDGCSLENWGATFGGGCFAQRDGPGTLNTLHYHDEDTWVSRVNTLLDAARFDLRVAAMTGSAGCQSPLQTYLPPPTRRRLDSLHLASYLMAVRRGAGTETGPLIGTSMFFAPDGVGMSVGKLWEPYTWDVGSPLIPTPANFNVTSFRADTPGVFVRYFSKAVAIVCPGNEDAKAMTALSRGPYQDLLTGEKNINEVRMTAHTGRVLMRQQSNDLPTPIPIVKG